MKHTKKIVVIILVLFVIWFVWQRYSNKNRDGEIDFYTVSRSDVIETVSASGELVPVDYANLSFAAPALVEWVGAEVGERVKKGQELIKLDRNSIFAEIKSARIDVDKAVLTEQQARRHWDEYKPEEQDRIKKDVEQSRARLYGAQSQLSKTMLAAPIDGIVTQKNIRVGEVANGVVMRVIDDGAMEIEVLMSETDAAKIDKGQKAFAVFDAYSDEELDVDIISIDPEAITIQDVTYYKITAVLTQKSQKKLLAGMSVDVDVIVQEKNNVLTVPLRFVRRDDEGAYAYVQSAAGEHVKKYIEIGIEGDDGSVEIIDGLGEGENVYAIYEE